jgi:hypothetical protein
MEEYRKLDSPFYGKNYNNYSVSNFGNIRNDDISRVLKHIINTKVSTDDIKIYEVSLCHEYKYTKYRVMELVAHVFNVVFSSIDYIKYKDKYAVYFKADNGDGIPICFGYYDEKVDAESVVDMINIYMEKRNNILSNQQMQFLENTKVGNEIMEKVMFGELI